MSDLKSLWNRLGVCRTLAAEYGIMVGNKSLP